MALWKRSAGSAILHKPFYKVEFMTALIIPRSVSIKKVFLTWWPLAFSWLLMSAEIPALSAVIARLANPEINLAAYGGIVYPVALIVEAPIIMLLSASTALCKDWATYQKLYRFMMVSAAILTLLHMLIAFTPLYYFVARTLIGVPEAVVESGKLGLMLITPWTWAIAYRRFQQGVLIRFGYSQVVGLGTVVRLTGGGIILVAGYLMGSVQGVAVGAVAQAVGVVSEAVFIGLRVRPVLDRELKHAPLGEPLVWKKFSNFYIPLAMTSFLGLLWQPLGSAALSRMPDPLVSLAVWPVAAGLVTLFRSTGFALNEVVVALLDREGSFGSLRRFAFGLAGIITALQIAALLTPAAMLWFTGVSALPQKLADLAWNAFWLAVPMAGLTVFQSWFQGSILYSRKTRAIPEATAIFLSVFTAIAIFGIAMGNITGLYIGMVGFVAANAAQAGWLWWRSRHTLQLIQRRDEA
jgi:hypothetical protein